MGDGAWVGVSVTGTTGPRGGRDRVRVRRRGRKRDPPQRPSPPSSESIRARVALPGTASRRQPETGTIAAAEGQATTPDATDQDALNVGTAGVLEAPAVNGEPGRNRTFNLRI